MNPGMLKYKVVVKRPTTVTDEFGAKSTTYAIAHTLWGAVRWVSGNKTIDNYEMFANESIQVTLYSRDISYTDVLTIDGKNYKINAIVPDNSGLYKIINAEKINE